MIDVQLQEIPGYENFISVEPILEDGSGEDKYCVTTSKGERFFLRIGICEFSYENHKKHIRAEALDISIAKTIRFGLFSDKRYYYWLLTWLDGISAFEVLPTLDKSGQFNLGVKTGKLLCKIHSLPIHEDVELLHEWLGKNIVFFTNDVRKKHAHNSEIHNKIIAYVALIIFAMRETQEWVEFIGKWYEERIVNAVSMIPQWYIDAEK